MKPEVQQEQTERTELGTRVTRPSVPSVTSCSNPPSCDYLVLGEPGQPQRRCGEPAVWWRASDAGRRFHYCGTCARRAEDLTRGKITLHPVKEGL